MLLKTTTMSLSTALILTMVGCGSSSSNSSDDNNEFSFIEGKIVDPYIVGAVLCEDVNRDGVCSDSEQKSTSSTLNGEFKFSNPLTIGSHIITSTQGIHNGLEYDIALSGIVDENGEINVVSPLTTLQTKGLSKAQIASILSDAGLSLSEEEVSSDPMEGVSGKTSVTDAELKKLQSSLATYGLLKVMKGSEALSALTSTQLASSLEIRAIATQMVTTIKSSLNAQTFATIKTQMDSVKDQVPPQYASYVTIPDVTTDVVIKTAVTIMDRLSTAGYEKCNETDGNVTLALAEVSSLTSGIASQIQDIAQYYYGLENKTELATINSYSPNSLPQSVKDGMVNETGVLKLDEGNTLVVSDQEKISTEAISNYIELNGGTLGDDEINIDAKNSSVKSIKLDDNATYTFSSNTTSIPLSAIKDGKNKFTITMQDNSEKYFYVYKGLYDANEENLTFRGNTSYEFTSLKADGIDANDIFVRVDNNNNVATTSDDYRIVMLPDNDGKIYVNYLNSSSGHSVLSTNYEPWRVASANNHITAQDTNMSYEVALNSIVPNTTISGSFLKIDENSSNEAVAFAQSDLIDNDIWLHPHYTHPTAKYSALYSGEDTSIEPTISNESIFVATRDMHISSPSIGTSYNFTTGEYAISGLSGDHNYTILAFWLNKNISLSYTSGTITSGQTSTNNDITLQSVSKEVNGTLSGDDTTLKLARVVTFAGQPTIHYSNTILKDANNSFTIEYQQDSEGTKSYILWGSSDDDLLLSESSNCYGVTNCREIIIGGDNDSSTDITLP